ncbi:MAG: outer membrane lipoprotein-sorting protein [Halanaerobiales bacterium]
MSWINIFNEIKLFYRRNTRSNIRRNRRTVLRSKNLRKGILGKKTLREKKAFHYFVMMLLTFGVLISYNCLAAASNGNTEILSGEEILARVSFVDIGQGESYYMDMLMVTQREGSVEEAAMRVYLNRQDGSEKSIATFLEPKDLQDDLYLSIDNNTWMYQEGLMRPIRISPRQKLFGEAGVAETVGIDYAAKYSVVNNNEEGNLFYLELEANDSSTAYQKAKLWIEKESFDLSKVVLMALNGQSLKELRYSNYRVISGLKVSDILIKNLLYENERSTELRIQDINRSNIPVEAFQPLMLSKFDLYRRESE